MGALFFFSRRIYLFERHNYRERHRQLLFLVHSPNDPKSQAEPDQSQEFNPGLHGQQGSKHLSHVTAFLHTLAEHWIRSGAAGMWVMD